MPETAKRHEIRQKPGRLVALFAFMAVLALAMLAVLIMDLRLSPERHFATWLALGGFLGFGLLAAALARRLRFGRGVVIVLAPEGFRDLRLAPSTVSWTAVRRVEIRGGRHPEVMLELDDQAFARLFPARWRRWLWRVNGLGRGWVASPSLATEIGREEYRDLLRAYAAAHGGLRG